VGSSNFISYGRWYGADAAKAWASIADWAIEHCETANSAVRQGRDERVYISSVEARAFDPYSENPDVGPLKHTIVIYYWVVWNGERMEDGRRKTRSFYFK
jgi:hypothetical protein